MVATQPRLQLTLVAFHKEGGGQRPMVEAACVGGLLRGCRLLPCRGRQERTTRFTVINTCMAYRFVLIYLYAFLNLLHAMHAVITVNLIDFSWQPWHG